MPTDLSEKDKVIGGLLTLNQALWLVPGFILALIVFALLQSLLKIFVIIPMVLCIGIFLPFVFYKIKDVPLPTYLFRKFKFNKKNKYLINERDDFDFFKEEEE